MQFYIRVRFLKIAQKLPIIWASFVRNFIADRFQKSPNLVALFDSLVQLISACLGKNALQSLSRMIDRLIVTAWEHS